MKISVISKGLNILVILVIECLSLVIPTKHLTKMPSSKKELPNARKHFNDAPDSLPPAFNAFMPVTEDEVYKCISESPTKSCSLDPIPTFLLKDCLDILLSSITKLVNHSLIEGSFPNLSKRRLSLSS